jgi:hypothetical protein
VVIAQQRDQHAALLTGIERRIPQHDLGVEELEVDQTPVDRGGCRGLDTLSNQLDKVLCEVSIFLCDYQEPFGGQRIDVCGSNAASQLYRQVGDLENRSFQSPLCGTLSIRDLPHIDQTRQQTSFNLNQSAVHREAQCHGKRWVCQESGLDVVGFGQTDAAEGRLKEWVAQQAELDCFSQL